MRGIRERSLLLKRERGGKFPFYLPTYLPTVVIIYLSIHPSIHPSSKLHKEEPSFCLEAFVVAFVFSSPLPPPPLG